MKALAFRIIPTKSTLYGPGRRSFLMEITNKYQTFCRPPASLKKAKQLDNIAIVPASQLPFKNQWQEVANTLPEGSVLLCHSVNNTRQQKILENVSDQLQKKGHKVKVVQTEEGKQNPDIQVPII